MRVPRPYGPRGVFMLGFGVTSAALGTSILLTGGRSKALAWLTDFFPYWSFGILWVIIGAWLLVSAFQTKQSKALGGLAGMCFFWGTAYLISEVINLRNGGDPGLYIMTPLFYGIAIACAAAVRMVNPAVSHLEVVKKAGPVPDDKQGKTHG